MKRFLIAVAMALLALAGPSAAFGKNVSAAEVAYRAPYFDSEAAAQAHCPRDVVVWLNTPTGIYHYKGERWYARTRHGAFVCEKEAIAEGDRASRNGQ